MDTLNFGTSRKDRSSKQKIAWCCSIDKAPWTVNSGCIKQAPGKWFKLGVEHATDWPTANVPLCRIHCWSCLHNNPLKWYFPRDKVSVLRFVFYPSSTHSMCFILCLPKKWVGWVFTMLLFLMTSGNWWLMSSIKTCIYCERSSYCIGFIINNITHSDLSAKVPVLHVLCSVMLGAGTGRDCRQVRL
jgi:hypothetical protein